MHFLTSWTSLNYGLLWFNYSIVIQYRLTACTWARKSTADYWLTSLCRLLCSFLARGLKMMLKEIQDVSNSNGKGENYQQALTLLNEAVDILRSPRMSSCHSFITRGRTSHTPTTSMMFGISPSGWSKNLQTKPNKRVVRNWPHGYNPFPITFGGARQPAMGMCSFCVKSGSLF